MGEGRRERNNVGDGRGEIKKRIFLNATRDNKKKNSIYLSGVGKRTTRKLRATQAEVLNQYSVPPVFYIRRRPHTKSRSGWRYAAKTTGESKKNLHASSASFSMSLYSSTIQPLCASALLKMTYKLFENDIKLKTKVRYTIKNLFCCSLLRLEL